VSVGFRVMAMLATKSYSKGKAICVSLLLQQSVRKVAVHLAYVTQIWLSVSTLPLQCAVVSLYSVVKQRLKCNTVNLLKTERRSLYLKAQSVPHCKHFSSRL
jgi:hypothetical protein